jgi:hypothetical protein
MNTATKICFLIIGIIAGKGINSIPQSNIEPHKASPIDYESIYQGDILLTAEQKAIIRQSKDAGNSPSSLQSRTGTLALFKRWPKMLGKVWVPYLFDPLASVSEFLVIFTCTNCSFSMLPSNSVTRTDFSHGRFKRN